MCRLLKIYCDQEMMGLNSLVRLMAHHPNFNVMALCIVVWSFLLASVC